MSEDTESTVTGEEVAAPLSMREQTMERIVSKTLPAEETVIEEIKPDPITGEDDDPVIKEADDIVLKVDGQEFTAPVDKVLDAGKRALQKESSADRRLEEAARVEAEAVAKNAELDQRRADLDALEQQLLSKQEETTDPDEFGQRFEESLFTEDGEVARTMSGLRKEIDELRGNVTKVSSVVEKVGSDVQSVNQREQAKAATEKENATAHFHSEYIDIASDQRSLSIFNEELNKIMSSGQATTVTEAVDKAASAFYDWKGGKPETPKPSKKEQLTRQPVGGSRRKAPPPTEKEETQSDILAEMRGNRGLK